MSDDVMAPILESLQRHYSSLFGPHPLLLRLPINSPPIQYQDQVLLGCENFDPSAKSHQNVIVLIYHEDYHWYLLVHFISIGSIVVFNSTGTNTTLSGGPGNLDPEQVQQTFAHTTYPAVQRYMLFTENSRAGADLHPEGLGIFINSTGGGLQQDAWSCGLWCLGFLQILYSKISDHHVVYGMNINYLAIRDEIITLADNMQMQRMEIATAQRYLRREWNSQWIR